MSVSLLLSLNDSMDMNAELGVNISYVCDKNCPQKHIQDNLECVSRSSPEVLGTAPSPVLLSATRGTRVLKPKRRKTRGRYPRHSMGLADLLISWGIPYMECFGMIWGSIPKRLFSQALLPVSFFLLDFEVTRTLTSWRRPGIPVWVQNSTQMTRVDQAVEGK